MGGRGFIGPRPHPDRRSGWQMTLVNAQWIEGGLTRPSRKVDGGCEGDHRSPEGFGGLVNKDLAIIRTLETVIALVIAVVLYQVLSAGALTSVATTATDWYTDKVDGLFTIAVVDTSIKLPQLERESLPIPSAPLEETAPATDTTQTAAELANR